MKHTTAFYRSCLLSVMTLASACVTDEPTELDDELGEIDHEIMGGTMASTFQFSRGVLLTRSGTRTSMYCTGTLVASRFVLTAAHCRPMNGDRALFYTSTANPDEVSDRVVDGVFFPPGVNPSTNDLTDTAGKFADMAVVRLATAAPATSVASTMAWTYPRGGDDAGVKVGAGTHENNAGLRGLLMQVADWTYSDSDADGHFLTENEQANSGDSGGPFYTGSSVLGVLYGRVFEWEYRNKYTSTPLRLPWILGIIGYSWSGDPPVSYRRLLGTELTQFVADSYACQYACDRTSTCTGYNYKSGRCHLLRGPITSSVGDGLARSAIK